MLRMEECHKMPAERDDSCRKARSRWNSILRRPKSSEQEKSHCGSATAKTDIGKCPLKLLCRDGDYDSLDATAFDQATLTTYTGVPSVPDLWH